MDQQTYGFIILGDVIHNSFEPIKGRLFSCHPKKICSLWKLLTSTTNTITSYTTLSSYTSFVLLPLYFPIFKNIDPYYYFVLFNSTSNVREKMFILLTLLGTPGFRWFNMSFKMLMNGVAPIPSPTSNRMSNF